MPRAAVIAKGAAVIALALGYTMLAHYTNTAAGNENLGAVIALAPLLIAALSLAWRSPRRPAMLALFVAGCGALALAWPAIEHHYSRVYWFEHAGTQLALCLVFARTLGQGREPICSYFARMVHGSLTPVMQRYTRQLTAAWVIFFGAMAATSTILFVAAPLNIWSAFANFFTLPVTCLMFIAEFQARRHAHLDMQEVSIMAAVKAVWKSPGGQLSATPHHDVHHANAATDYPPAR